MIQGTLERYPHGPPSASRTNISGNREHSTMKLHRPAKTRAHLLRYFAILAIIVAPVAGIFGWNSQYASRLTGGRASATTRSSSPVRVNGSAHAEGRRLAFRPYEPM